MSLGGLWPAILQTAGVLLTGGLAAAIVTLFQNRWLEKRRADEAERARLRQCFAEAFATYADYKEFPYRIRRRRADRPAQERARLTSDLNAIQSRLNYYQAWTQFESPTVGYVYDALLVAARQHAGSAMQAAWAGPPPSTDEGMNIPAATINLSALAQPERDYSEAVAARLATLTPRRLRRG